MNRHIPTSIGTFLLASTALFFVSLVITESSSISFPTSPLSLRSRLHLSFAGSFGRARQGYGGQVSGAGYLLPTTSPHSQTASVLDSDSSLVAHYTFDDVSNLGADSSGKGNNGTLQGANGLPTATAGKVGSGAIKFDGVDDGLDIKSSPNLNLSSTNAFTISAWINPSIISASTKTIVARGSINSSAVNTTYYIGNYTGAGNGSRITSKVSDGIQVITLTTNVNGFLEKNKWIHTTLVFDGTAKTLTLYKNGVYYDQAVNSSFGNLWDGDDPNDKQTGIGATLAGGTPGNSWNGSIDDVRIYKRALSVSEIQNLYSSGPSSGDVLVSTDGSCGGVAKDYNATDTLPDELLCATTKTANVVMDASKPIISNVQVSRITSFGSTISWITDKSSDTQIEYGLNNSYGFFTTLDSLLTTSHHQDLTGLQANTTYHYRVRSKDVAGNLSFSGDEVFSTGIEATHSSCSSIFTCYYVRAGAAGLRNGSNWNDAYASLPSVLQRGATYYIADGSYGSYIYDDNLSGMQYITIKKATILDHGTDIGWVNSYGEGKVYFTGEQIVRRGYYVFDGNSYPGYGFNITSGPRNWSYGFYIDTWGVGSSYYISHIVLKDFEIDMSESTGWTLIDVKGIKNDNGDNVLFRNVSIKNFGDGISSDGSDGSIYEYLNIEHTKMPEGCHDHADAIVLTGGSNNVIRYSRFNWKGQQVYFGGTGLTLDQWDIYGNIFYGGDSAQGIVASGQNVMTNLKIYNNTFSNLQTFPIILAGASTGSAKNNLFYGNRVTPVFGTLSHDFNFYEAGKSLNEINGKIGNDPFVNYNENDYRLKNGIYGDRTIGTDYNTDILGNIRGVDGIWDIGAYEYSSTDSGSSTIPTPPPNDGPPTNPTPTTPPPSCTTYPTGDFNHDCAVNSLDFSALSAYWNQQSSTYDLTGDNLVNTLDYVVLVKNWSK